MRLEYFQLLDRVVEVDPAERTITAEAVIPTNNTIFEGHFPGFPLMPGVLLLEVMAQTSGWLVLALNRFQRMAFLVAAKEVKFRTFAKPGQSLSVRAELVHEGSGFAITSASVSIDGKVICDAEITLRLLDFPSDEMKQQMRVMAARVGLPTGAPADG